MASYKKDPDATLDYTFDWAPYLLPVTDTIASVTFILTGGLTQVSKSNTTTKATVFVSGGTVNTTATITCRITTNSTPPRIDDRTMEVKIVPR